VVNEITDDNSKHKVTIKVNDNIWYIEDNLKEASNVLNNYFTDVNKMLANQFNKRSNLVLNIRDKNIPWSFDNIFLDKVDVSEIRINI